MKYCVACEDLFEPSVSKIAKYCSADCAYDREGKNVKQCPWCGDDFDVKFTKTFVGCNDICDGLLGMKILQRLSRRFAQEHDSYALLLVSEKILEFCGPLCDTPENAKKRFEMREAHGPVPPGGCKACWDENPRNWDNPPNWIKNERIVPLSEILPPGSRETRRFKTARKESECQSQDLLPPTTS